jgi:sarcosine oxidase subunit gamma
VIAEAVRRSPLSEFAERFAAVHDASGGAVSIGELRFVSQVNLRADPRDPGLMHRFRSTLGFALPTTPNTTASAGDRRALWLGPDEWLLVAPEGQVAALVQSLQESLAGAFASIVDVSANRTVLQISGPGATDLLAHGMPIDLHPRVFRKGQCAQTLLAKSQVIIEQPADGAGFLLYARSSFAGYLADWLLDNAGVS